MGTAWLAHAKCLTILALLAAPVFVADRAFLGPDQSGRGMLPLDFRGLLIGAYGAYAVLHVAITTAAIGWRHSGPADVVRIHLVTFGALVGLALGIFWLVRTLQGG